MDPSGPVTTDWKKIISTAASDKWIEFGRALLRTSTRQITDITSRLANPSPLAPKDKLVKILERWLSIGAEPAGETERRSRPATRTELKKACQEEKILGGVNRVLKEKYKRDPCHEWEEVPLHYSDDLLKAVAEMGSANWRSFGRWLLRCTAVELDNVCGEAGITNSDRVHYIIDHWLHEHEGEVTVEKLLEVCRELGIRGRVELDVQEYQLRNQLGDGDNGDVNDDVNRDSLPEECDMY